MYLYTNVYGTNEYDHLSYIDPHLTYIHVYTRAYKHTCLHVYMRVGIHTRISTSHEIA